MNDLDIRHQIARVIEHETEEWCDRYGYADAQGINCGDCHCFAKLVCVYLSTLGIEAKAVWCEDCPENDEDPNNRFSSGEHAFIAWNDLAFDSERPFGVEDWWTLPTFERVRDERETHELMIRRVKKRGIAFAVGQAR